jgi:hypothetical protein
VDAIKENYTTGCGCMKRDPYQRLWMKKETYDIGYRSLFIHLQHLVWVYFYSTTTSGMALLIFIHKLRNRSLFIHMKKETYDIGYG